MINRQTQINYSTHHSIAGSNVGIVIRVDSQSKYIRRNQTPCVNAVNDGRDRIYINGVTQLSEWSSNEAINLPVVRAVGPILKRKKLTSIPFKFDTPRNLPKNTVDAFETTQWLESA